MITRVVLVICCNILYLAGYSQSPTFQVLEKSSASSFPLANGSNVTTIYVDAADHPLVRRSAALLASDIQLVTGKKPTIVHQLPAAANQLVIIGSIDKSSVIQQLTVSGKLHTNDIKGKWEGSKIAFVTDPAKGIRRALVITGSDRRGTAYGVLQLSKDIGVSPWYWWADVPAQKKNQIHIASILKPVDTPAVKYRGIFINDEAPALTGWSKEKFGGFNHQFYEKVFELILRLKGNYLWPAMWGSAFYDDDPQNKQTAADWGIVIGTTHHEPLMRAHDEWRRYGTGKWNYDSNEVRLQQFWKGGMERSLGTETIVSVGMRGDGDEPMTQGTAISLLERIVRDQRKIIGEVTHKDPSATPQLWALYKEVQDYYDKGMRVPDDVTLLLCDDNWGNIRKLPRPDDPPRSGGYGIYYHYDYVGGPRNYKWINTNQVERVWEQMHLAYEYGVNRIWIVNVGDIKPMEFPISFFLDYAWQPKAIQAQDLKAYGEAWAAEQFGRKYAAEIADIIRLYSRYNSRRKPELLSPETYSLTNYHEAEKVVDEYYQLLARAEKTGKLLPPSYKDAYYQLVLHPVEASANLHAMYMYVARNRLYAKQGRASANLMAAKAKELYIKDSVITVYYHKSVANGKWNHMMDQTHIGYTYWQQPPNNSMPKTAWVDTTGKRGLGIAIEGNDQVITDSSHARLPSFHAYQPERHFIDLFNKGGSVVRYTIETGTPWLIASKKKGDVPTDERIWVSVDWPRVPHGVHRQPVTITDDHGNKTVINTEIIHRPGPEQAGATFFQKDGYVSIEAADYTRAIAEHELKWQVVPGLGRTGDAVIIEPVKMRAVTVALNSPHLEYDCYLIDTGRLTITTYLSPTLNFNNQGLRYAISFDDAKPQIIDVHGNYTNRAWEQWVANNIITSESTHQLSSGRHVLKYWLIDAALPLQKIVVNLGGVKPSYLGPPETLFNRKDAKTRSIFVAP